ncbi:helix-turn-helix transcriptional regulator [Erythrobacter sp. WG]|uniref:helix-turn-helix transcriptional regulator n=1 Tax=Erythrobacter sp. WG TaxID=2985510 RepID=UPI00226FE80D|nr:AraC family transcriptional regulator [Erythrobacter sp. WG]MCX9146504.1 helix-turn-helix transcriptional regulator [Erythrobacter sp. WG]
MASGSACAARSARADAERAIGMMGTRATTRVPTATLLHLGEWLAWPDWLRDGTSLADGSGPLPPMVTRADDILIMANIVDNTDTFALVEDMLTRPRPALSLAGELAVLHGPDLGASVKAVARGLAARNLWVRVAVSESEAEIEIAIRPVWPMGELFRSFALCALTLLHRAVTAYRGDRLEGMRLATSLHDLPQAQAALGAFRCAIMPSDRAEALLFPRSWLNQPNPHFDPLVWDVANAKIMALENEVAGDPTIDPLRHYITGQLTEMRQVPRLKQAAAHLGISTRTIVRSLARQQTTFHKLVEEERKARALALIADPTLPLADVAKALGFSDTSSFGRSFRKWFAETPGNLRSLTAL